MNDINEMWTICQSCPYWEVCEPPYICAKTEAKYRNDKEEKVTEWIEENFADRPAYEVVAAAKKTTAKTREGMKG